MISASPLVGAYPRARPVDAAMAHAASSHAAVPRADLTNIYLKPRPAAVVEPVILLLTAGGASFLLGIVVAGIIL